MNHRNRDNSLKIIQLYICEYNILIFLISVFKLINSKCNFTINIQHPDL